MGGLGKASMASRYEPWTLVRDQLVLGSETFARQVGRRARKTPPLQRRSEKAAAAGGPTIDEVFAVVGRGFREKVEVIRRPRSLLAREAVDLLRKETT